MLFANFFSFRLSPASAFWRIALLAFVATAVCQFSGEADGFQDSISRTLDLKGIGKYPCPRRCFLKVWGGISGHRDQQVPEVADQTAARQTPRPHIHCKVTELDFGDVICVRPTP